MSGIVETIRGANASGDAFLLRVQLHSGESLRGAVMVLSFDDLEQTNVVDFRSVASGSSRSARGNTNRAI
ncbi:hypothetical protein, partial [Paraburkholderia caledonica]|uniref:hypothetical protein n=1 Tax=Paraburkholderia caledonica TaxID=134536 RepID=UPI001C4FABA0